MKLIGQAGAGLTTAQNFPSPTQKSRESANPLTGFMVCHKAMLPGMEAVPH